MQAFIVSNADGLLCTVSNLIIALVFSALKINGRTLWLDNFYDDQFLVVMFRFCPVTDCYVWVEIITQQKWLDKSCKKPCCHIIWPNIYIFDYRLDVTVFRHLAKLIWKCQMLDCYNLLWEWHCLSTLHQIITTKTLALHCQIDVFLIYIQIRKMW